LAAQSLSGAAVVHSRGPPWSWISWVSQSPCYINHLAGAINRRARCPDGSCPVLCPVLFFLIVGPVPADSESRARALPLPLLGQAAGKQRRTAHRIPNNLHRQSAEAAFWGAGRGLIPVCFPGGYPSVIFTGFPARATDNATGPVRPDVRFRLNNRAVLSLEVVGYYYDFDNPAPARAKPPSGGSSIQWPVVIPPHNPPRGHQHTTTISPQIPKQPPPTSGRGRFRARRAGIDPPPAQAAHLSGCGRDAHAPRKIWRPEVIPRAVLTGSPETV
jgi:hypothetical protein